MNKLPKFPPFTNINNPTQFQVANILLEFAHEKNIGLEFVFRAYQEMEEVEKTKEKIFASLEKQEMNKGLYI